MRLFRRIALAALSVVALTGCIPSGPITDGWISIDRMGVSRPTYLGDSDGSERSLDFGPSRVFGTAEMCQPGNSVIAGHRTSKGGPFRAINRLQIGDVIHVEPASTPGRPCSYRVVNTRIVYVGNAAASAAVAADVLSQAPKFGSSTRLTLSSCTRPDGRPSSLSYRYIVELVLV